MVKMEKAYYTTIEFTTVQNNGEWGKGGWAMTNYWTDDSPKIITLFTCYGKTKAAAEDLLMKGLTCDGKREVILVEALSKKLKAEFIAELSIGDEIYSLNWGISGMTYILYPDDNKIMKGVVTEIVVSVKKDRTEITKYNATFKENNYSFFRENIGTFIFKSEKDLKEYYNKLRKKENNERAAIKIHSTNAKP